ncbi:MAG: protein phosphatase 2C domain-containing protein [Coriobacteriales bacterium]|jgi:serine/threonine protein phosphatase PrpC|nr:protein phosphatase 2C domain-containing protein [Coriobacteriales bacterium]
MNTTSAFNIGYASDAGSQKDVNQDAALILSAHDAVGNEYVLTAVCDGVGGLELGECMSGAACTLLAEWFAHELPALVAGMAAGGVAGSGPGSAHLTTGKHLEGLFDRAEAALRTLIIDANRSFLAYSSEQQVEMGTTVCALLVVNPAENGAANAAGFTGAATGDAFPWLACVIGDTRLYQLNTALGEATVPGEVIAATATITQLSQDQTLANLSEAERARYRLDIARLQGADESQVLAQCLGLTEDINPVFLRGSAGPNTAFLLCSDGFRHRLASSEMLAAFLPREDDAAHTAGAPTTEELSARLQALIQTNIARGESDNITAVYLGLVGAGNPTDTRRADIPAASTKLPSSQTEVLHA